MLLIIAVAFYRHPPRPPVAETNTVSLGIAPFQTEGSGAEEIGESFRLDLADALAQIPIVQITATHSLNNISRDDSGRFLAAYIDKGIFEKDPFVSLDQEGVGDLIRIAAERGRAQRPGMKMGICGEHGGDPASIAFCESVGLDYVSCSPYRTPIARLAAAQATLSAGENN